MGQPRFLHLGLIALLALLPACGHDADAGHKGLVDEIYAGGGGSGDYFFTSGDPGTVTGKVMLAGKPMKFRDKPVKGDAFCDPLYPKGIENETIVVNPDNSIKWCFVRIKKGLARYPVTVPSTPVVLNQKGCRYEPHVAGVMVGQKLAFKNSDPTLHNVHAIPLGLGEINIPQKRGQEDTRTFDKPEANMVKVWCDVHGWMESWIGVVSHPFFAVTGDDGAFKLENVPPGKYQLEVWCQAFPGRPFLQDIEVKSGEVTPVPVEFKRE